MDISCAGLCEPCNPNGHATWGFVAVSERSEIQAAFGTIGHGEGMTNNVAAYTAVIEALKWGYKTGRLGFSIYTDSKLVVEQSLGHWACNTPHLKILRDRVIAGMIECQSAGQIYWIPREENQRADELAHMAYHKYGHAAI